MNLKFLNFSFLVYKRALNVVHLDFAPLTGI